MDEKKLEVMKMVVDGEKLEENENIKISEVLVQLKAEPYIRTTHPTQPRSKYFGEELQLDASIHLIKFYSMLPGHKLSAFFAAQSVPFCKDAFISFDFIYSCKNPAENESPQAITFTAFTFFTGVS